MWTTWRVVTNGQIQPLKCFIEISESNFIVFCSSLHFLSIWIQFFKFSLNKCSNVLQAVSEALCLNSEPVNTHHTVLLAKIVPLYITYKGECGKNHLWWIVLWYKESRGFKVDIEAYMPYLNNQEQIKLWMLQWSYNSWMRNFFFCIKTGQTLLSKLIFGGLF